MHADAAHTATITPNQQLANELHKLIIRKSQNHKAYLSLSDKTWFADFDGMELVSKYNKGIHFVLCVRNAFSKYARFKRYKR